MYAFKNIYLLKFFELY